MTDTAAGPGFALPRGVEPGRAVVVGAGPNGLTAAALLAREGWEVDVFERAPVPGGACASAPVLGEGTVVDLGAAGHPFGVASPVFRELGLTDHGLAWLHPAMPMGHPLPDGPAALLHRDLEATAAGLGVDARAWRAVHGALVAHVDEILAGALGPVLRPPPHPVAMARFGLRAPWPADLLGRAMFRTEAARALFTGSAAHAILPSSRPLTAAFGALFGALGMSSGWPVARGGSGAIVDALVAVLRAHGGRLHLGQEVTDLRALPAADAVVLDLTPRQVLRVAGTGLPPRYATALRRWRPGPSVSKVDFLLDGPIPWRDARLAGAGTVHLGGTATEIRRAEDDVAAGRMPARPFVMLCQQQAADPSRATGPARGHTVVWSYAHVPHGHPGDVRPLIEAEVERHAPGFRDRIEAAVAMRPADLEAWNPNLVGGDIAGGSLAGARALLRPAASPRPHRAGRAGLYLASASTPPGAGVHGMGGAWAVRTLLAERRR
ncbi:phytoene dehydrogenase-like protein [Micrococcus sp. 093350064-1]